MGEIAPELVLVKVSVPNLFTYATDSELLFVETQDPITALADEIVTQLPFADAVLLKNFFFTDIGLDLLNARAVPVLKYALSPIVFV